MAKFLNCMIGKTIQSTEGPFPDADDSSIQRFILHFSDGSRLGVNSDCNIFSEAFFSFDFVDASNFFACDTQKRPVRNGVEIKTGKTPPADTVRDWAAHESGGILPPPKTSVNRCSEFDESY